MSEHIAVALSKRVRQRARHVCEYGRLPRAAQEAAFHIDPIQQTNG